MTPAELATALAMLNLLPIEAARRIGVSRSAVSRWLAGNRPIPEYAVLRIKEWLAAL